MFFVENNHYLVEEDLNMYFKYLIGKFFKILPMKEQGCSTLDDYLKSFLNELLGNYELCKDLRNNPQYITLLNITSYLATQQYDSKVCKREVFKAIKILEMLQKDGEVNAEP